MSNSVYSVYPLQARESSIVRTTARGIGRQRTQDASDGNTRTTSCHRYTRCDHMVLGWLDVSPLSPSLLCVGCGVVYYMGFCMDVNLHPLQLFILWLHDAQKRKEAWRGGRGREGRETKRAEGGTYCGIRSI